MSERNQAVIVVGGGSGTTIEAFIHGIQAQELPIDVVAAISNNRDAGMFGRLRRLEQTYHLEIEQAVINAEHFPGGPRGKYDQTEEEAEEFCKLGDKYQAALFLSAGYMRKFAEPFISEFGAAPGQDMYTARALNTHPGPLPATRGTMAKHAQARVIELGLDYSAQTLHVIAADYDTGATFRENRVRRLPEDTPESLFEAVQSVEKQYIARDVAAFLQRQSLIRSAG